MSRASASGMKRPSEPSGSLPQAENLVTVMGGVGKSDAGAGAEDVARRLPPLDERPVPPTLLGGSLPSFAR
jgi:hypothetical protein